jgi:hypothetical protein
MSFDDYIGDSTPEIKREGNFSLSDIIFDDIGFHPERNRVYVYVIVCIGTPFLKVGVSANPRKRVLAMQTGNPMPLKLAAVTAFSSSEIALQVESRMHFLLGSLNQSGEWFQAGLPYVDEALKKAAKQVRNKRGELGCKPDLKRKVHLNWNYSE